tara:strand:+ start:403 stop:1599 length:1197 start_codon:yes stop_codon:yes gene_type:complete
MLKTLEAINELLSLIKIMKSEKVNLTVSKGRVVSKLLKSKSTHPSKNISAMDGYAINKNDKIPRKKLKIIGESSAGKKFSGKIKNGECVQIFTGAVVPKGSNCIIIQEDVIKNNNNIIIRNEFDNQDYIRYEGSDFDKSFTIKPPKIITPFTQSLLASMNYTKIPVFIKPSVAIISTGNELVMPGNKKRDDQVFSSVSFGLKGLIEDFGGKAFILPILKDNKNDIQNVFLNLKKYDLVITVGGASEGKYDLIRECLNNLKFKLKFFKISMRPGKPVFAGKLDNMPLIGLPGNPVSALICSQILIKPVIEKMLGLPFKRQIKIDATLTRDLDHNGNRTHYIRANFKKINNNVFVKPRKNQDSFLINELNKANCLIIKKRNEGKNLKGEQVEIIKILKNY